jgi:aspartyl-tRNA(Asn)/glutamyl-tRNA(Gln) amidotransferase subunit B
MSKYETVIGIETHVQLSTKSKLFCTCSNDSRSAEPNTNVCPVCLGFPGALPVLNEQAVKLTLRAGMALNAYGKAKEFHSKFDRKNYFYPDSPMNYQITQFDEPLIGNGYVEFSVDGETKKVGVTRAHLEADAGKLVHPAGADYSLVDLNRAGTPLLEIVSEPDMRSAAEAKAYTQEIYHLMRYAGVSDANLYYGNMRFDVNVSLRPVGSKKLGTRTESKNLNSFRAVAGVVEYETQRQTEILDCGDKVVQETRGWDEHKNQTFSQRSKEEAHDYRYFPEPDLPPLVITEKMLDKARMAMPQLMPNDIRTRLETYATGAQAIEKIINEPMLSELLLAHPDYGDNAIKQIINWFNGYPDDDLQKFIAGWSEIKAEDGGRPIRVLLRRLAEITAAIDDNKVSSTNAKVLFDWVLRKHSSQQSPLEFAKSEGLLQVSDTAALEKITDQVIADNPKPVAEYKAGEEKVLGFLVGRVMKASKGQANPPMVNAILKKKLGG